MQILHNAPEALFLLYEIFFFNDGMHFLVLLLPLKVLK